MKDLKYLVSYSIPLAAVIGLSLRGYWVYFTPVFAFVLIPILEVLLPVQTKNLSEEEVKSKDKNVFFDLLLYLNLPVVYGILCWFLWSISFSNYSTMELTGLVISLGIVVGSNGINVAHELGHRTTQWKKLLGNSYCFLLCICISILSTILDIIKMQPRPKIRRVQNTINLCILFGLLP